MSVSNKLQSHAATRPWARQSLVKLELWMSNLDCMHGGSLLMVIPAGLEANRTDSLLLRYLNKSNFSGHATDLLRLLSQQDLDPWSLTTHEHFLSACC